MGTYIILFLGEYFVLIFRRGTINFLRIMPSTIDAWLNHNIVIYHIRSSMISLGQQAVISHVLMLVCVRMFPRKKKKFLVHNSKAFQKIPRKWISKPVNQSNFSIVLILRKSKFIVPWILLINKIEVLTLYKNLIPVVHKKAQESSIWSSREG